MLVVLSTQSPPRVQIGEDGIPLRFFGTDNEIASLLYREDCQNISRKTVRAWRLGTSKIPDWAQVQLSNIYWRKVILNNDLAQYGHTSSPPNPELSSTVVRGQEGRLLSPIYWSRVRRDGTPMYTPESATIPAARDFALRQWPSVIFGHRKILSGRITLYNTRRPDCMSRCGKGDMRN